MNRKEFCECFQIPYRTVTDWELGNRHAPEYVVRLLAYYIQTENMGLTSWSGKQIRRADTEIAKNYLTQPELDALNKIVSAYLNIAEVRALEHEPMYMKDWLETIDDYLKMTRRDILTTKGRITHQQAIQKAMKNMRSIRRSRMNCCRLLNSTL